MATVLYTAAAMLSILKPALSVLAWDSSHPCASSVGGRVAAAATVWLFSKLPVPLVIRVSAVVFSNCSIAARPFFLCISPYHGYRVRCSSIKQWSHA